MRHECLSLVDLHIPDACGDVQAMQAELEATRDRARELQTSVQRPRSAALTNKKDEDDVYDIEAAVLTGGGGSFKPLAGTVRGAIFPLNSRYTVALARKIDQLAVALDRRPAVRGGLLIYFVLLHFLVVMF